MLTQITRRAFLPASAALLAALLLTGCNGAPLFRATRTAQVAHAAGTPIRVVTDNGWVDISRAEVTDVQITAHLRAQTQERLDGASIAVVREADGQLSISVDWPGGHRRSNEGCDFDVKVPDARGVSVDTSNGRIKLAGLAGPAVLGTSNGAVEVAGQEGEVRAHTSNGHIDLRGVKGDAKARTTNGGIDVEGVTGLADCTTSNGHISVSLDSASPGPVFATSSNGGIRVEVGPGFRGKVSMRTSNGKIRVSGVESTGSDESRAVIIGQGGEESILGTSNGGIEFRAGR